MEAKFYEVQYCKANGERASLIVKARSEHEARINATNVCYTGYNFHNPTEVDPQPTFAQENNGHHSNRANQ